MFLYPADGSGLVLDEGERTAAVMWMEFVHLVVVISDSDQQLTASCYSSSAIMFDKVGKEENTPHVSVANVIVLSDG